ncbi:ribosomal protein L11 methyltransferase [Legionella quinlivanii]|uniref:Ribosomal protein L11 methyltransferase n=1 Tax=Legionella quinlivanii TaxID=45073 RepID=A0A0W0XS24_9GAMM|nr:50S ribosomal protein L11 methyltransferase [Legionella quinlivanii]KTD47413.1 ribosomal protein L11 methyltransferase [Legionella quinlivanii]SEG38175.1 [LSU ribosomal protein L11P]-lysine N-methyltransferase [Legionella quinlivanii DSM 21216]STY10028.1 ribosomal protein L11 methyltransferase [Legionella quinlivanii]
MWYQIQIENCQHEQIELLNDYLENAGALSITLTDKNDDPVLEPAPGTTPLWPDVVINALFSEESEALQTLNNLQSDFPMLNSHMESLPDQDWERSWMDDFKPQQFGKRLWICPSWHTPPEPEAVNLILDPGLAFGTGNHATTSLCLHWLGNNDVSGKTIIDYGCGSGILALAALKLGAKKAYAVDIDPQALQATENNAISNNLLNESLLISLPDALTEPVDLMIANILLSPLLQLKNVFHKLLNSKSRLLVSGILNEQAEGLVKEYEDRFALLQTHNHEGWSLLEFIRNE